MIKKILTSLFFLFAFPSVVLASIGVGIGTGKIEVKEILHSGVVYNLPPITVINTGDQAGDYGVGVDYLEKQPENRPDKEWFSFNPSEFYLEPTQAQKVDVKLTIPLKAIPGKYFAYVEGFPNNKVEGQTTVGVAAASKLYFEIAPTNFFQGIYYRALTLWKTTQPWSNIVAGFIFASVVAFVFSRTFKFNIEVKKKKNNTKNEEDSDSEEE